MSTLRRRPVPGGITVALVDGVALFRIGFEVMLSGTSGTRWLGAFPETRVAAEVLHERGRVDVLVFDSGMDPQARFCRQVLGTDEHVALLMLVQDGHRRTVTSALAAGVHGLVRRSAEPHQMIEAITAVHHLRRYRDPRLAPGLGPDVAGMPGPPLSQREYQVLELIADGMQNQEIAKKLFVSVETVRSHVGHILRKLGATHRTQAVGVAFRIGILRVPH